MAPVLFEPIKVGQMMLQHRVVLSPMTRFRTCPDHVPGPHEASYYAQRSSLPGSLLITEATVISHDAGGVPYVPGIYTDAQIQGWKKVTDAVHAKGSYIFLQLWAMGRTAEPDFLEKQDPPSPYVSASPIALTGRSNPPRPLTEGEISDYIAAYAEAASNAVYRAGFDGVEIHGGYGHLVDQFLQSVTNIRTDRWGGDDEGRTRFARECVDVVVATVGPERVGVRISPWGTIHDMKMPDPRPTFAYLTTALRDKHPKLAYLHVVDARLALEFGADKAAIAEESNDFLREIWNAGEGGDERVFISAGGHTRESALDTAESQGGLVAFGRLFISNPDLPIRLQNNLPLTAPQRSKFYLPGDLTPFGYNDWPFADGVVRDVDSDAK